jgi:transcriptional regulator with XRE-family HTH domain
MIQTALMEEQKKNGITQSDIARELGIHRSVVSKELRGRKDITLGRVAEYAWALGREIEFGLPYPKIEHGDNKPANIGGVTKKYIETNLIASSPVEVSFVINPISATKTHSKFAAN